MTINEFLQGDKFALFAGVELLETGNGYAKARMEIKPMHLNGGGVCQGGAIFTLADLAYTATVCGSYQQSCPADIVHHFQYQLLQGRKQRIPVCRSTGSIQP